MGEVNRPGCNPGGSYFFEAPRIPTVQGLQRLLLRGSISTL